MIDHGLSVIFISTLLCLGIVFYKFFIRPRFPVKVTCWFCGEKSTVAYDETNSFTCSSCEQYNGFDESGDFNKEIPAQYDELSNPPTSCRPDVFVGGESVLCKTCAQNQLMKVKQIANFVPYNENNFSWESDLYKQHLEKLYKLCWECEQKVREEIETQNEIIARRYNNHQLLDDSQFSQMHEPELLQENQTISTDPGDSSTSVIAGRVLHLLSLVCATCLLLRSLDVSQIPLLQDWCSVLHPILSELDREAFTVSIAGVFSGVVAKLLLGKYRIRLVDVISCPVWLVVLLIQAQFISGSVVNQWVETSCHVANIITCLLCAGVKRNRRDMPNINMNRSYSMRLATPGYENSSASLRWTEEEGEYTDEEDDNNIDTTPDVGSLTDSLSGLSSWISRQNKGPGVFSSSSLLFSPSPVSASQSNSRISGSMSDRRVSDFLADSQSNDRLSETLSVSQSHYTADDAVPMSQLNNRSYRTKSYHSGTPSPVRRRPIISPASFVYRSSPGQQTQHRFGAEPANNYGLFSSSSPPATSLICGYSFFSYRQPLFPPEKLAIQPKQSFGSSPYPDVQPWCKRESFERVSVREQSSEHEVEKSELYTVETKTQLAKTEEEAMEEEMVIEELVDRFLDLPALTCTTTNLRRSDSGFFSILSDTEYPSQMFTSVSTSHSYSTLPVSEPRPLIRTARFVYQSTQASTDPRNSLR